MDPAFWQDKWTRGEIGFHLPFVNPKLIEHWPALGVSPGARVLVPLAGKTLDLGWLRAQGHAVVACELSELAAREFFAEADLTPQVTEVGSFLHLAAGGIEYFVGDFFALVANLLGPVQGLYDRGALVALPPDLRARYVQRLRELTGPGTRTLLITLEYDQSQMNGPPFSVPEAAVLAAFGGTHDLSLRSREDILHEEPRFAARGVTALDSCVWTLVRR